MCARGFGYSTKLKTSTSDSLPRVAQPSVWQSIIPKVWRERRNQDGGENTAKPVARKGWNPYTFFIAIFILIGSNSVNMIALRNDFVNYSRKADAKIALLKEAIERVQAGEEFDVKALLGTGDPEKEQEWEEGM